MALIESQCYTIIKTPRLSDVFNETKIEKDLDQGDENVRIETLKKVIKLLLNGDRLPGLLMTILQNQTIMMLLLIFWEIVPKTTPDGKLLQEMILVCDAHRKDVQHPNEFLHGSTLRFLSKLKEPELLEPLIPVIRDCLDHRHSYVRRNAAIFTIYKSFEWLVPGGAELIANFFEQDMSCKRNAFLMLLHADQKRALNYLASCLDQVNNFGDILQLVIVELIYNFPNVTVRVIPVLAEFLSDTNEQAATDVLIFIREAIPQFPHLRSLTTEKLIETFPTIRSVKVHRAALWILGGYIMNVKDILEVIEGSIRRSVNTTLIDLHEYLEHLLKSTKMKCLTPETALSVHCGFMASNINARSIFGEDALANLSIEKAVDDTIAGVTGHIRIKSKSQGMALSLGDKINSTQKATAA